MERREELQEQQDAESETTDALQDELTTAQQALDAALVELETVRAEHGSRRDALAAGLAPDLSALYERLRAAGGPGAGPLQGHRCGACRIEIGRSELAPHHRRGRRRGAAVPGVRRDSVARQGF